MNTGKLVKWRHSDESIVGVIIKDLGIKTITREYLIFWLGDGIVENYETDLEFL